MNAASITLWASGTYISLMLIGQLLLSTHPDPKAFAESFEHSADYLAALPEYEQNPLTNFRSWWVGNYQALKMLVLLSIAGGIYGAILIKWQGRRK